MQVHASLETGTRNMADNKHDRWRQPKTQQYTQSSMRKKAYLDYVFLQNIVFGIYGCKQSEVQPELWTHGAEIMALFIYIFQW